MAYHHAGRLKMSAQPASLGMPAGGMHRGKGKNALGTLLAAVEAGGALKHYTLFLTSPPRDLKAISRRSGTFSVCLWTGEGSKTLLLKKGKAGRKKSVRSLFGNVSLFAVKNLSQNQFLLLLLQERLTATKMFGAEPQTVNLLPPDTPKSWAF